MTYATRIHRRPKDILTPLDEECPILGEGLSRLAAHALGFDVMCRCGHEDGLHDSNGKCAVLECECAP